MTALFFYVVFYKTQCADVPCIYMQCYLLLVNYSLYQYVGSLLVLVSSFGLKSALWGILIATSACFWIPTSWSFIFPPFIFSLCVFEDEMCLLQVLCLVGSWFFIYSTSLCLLIRLLNHTHWVLCVYWFLSLYCLSSTLFLQLLIGLTALPVKVILWMFPSLSFLFRFLLFSAMLG